MTDLKRRGNPSPTRLRAAEVCPPRPPWPTPPTSRLLRRVRDYGRPPTRLVFRGRLRVIVQVQGSTLTEHCSGDRMRLCEDRIASSEEGAASSKTVDPVSVPLQWHSHAPIVDLSGDARLSETRPPHRSSHPLDWHPRRVLRPPGLLNLLSWGTMKRSYVFCLAPEDGQGSESARQHRESRPLHGIRRKVSKGLNCRCRVLQNPDAWVPWPACRGEQFTSAASLRRSEFTFRKPGRANSTVAS